MGANGTKVMKLKQPIKQTKVMKLKQHIKQTKSNLPNQIVTMKLGKKDSVKKTS